MLNRLLFAFFTVCAIACASISSVKAQVFIVSTCGTVPSSQATLTAGNPGMLFIDTTGKLCTSATGGGASSVTIQPTSSSSAGITPVATSAAANNLVLKASAGNLYSVYATNQTATGGYLMVLNATSAPADGAVTPLECVPLPASGNAAISYGPGPPSVFTTGMVAVVSSGANCFTKTTGTITAYIKGAVQ